tara:strand:+ start:492 stop:782 length:291 start_codon:yes stop_codon:yes gene_type:complete
MKYLVDKTSGFNIVHNNPSGVSEITINLSLTKANVVLKNSTYIGGVYDLNTGEKNPGISYCEIQEKKPTITDDWISISSDTKNQLTLNLKTKLKQL